MAQIRRHPTAIRDVQSGEEGIVIEGMEIIVRRPPERPPPSKLKRVKDFDVRRRTVSIDMKDVLRERHGQEFSFEGMEIIIRRKFAASSA